MDNGIAPTSGQEAPINKPTENTLAIVSLITGGCIWAAVIYLILGLVILGLVLPILTWTAVPQPYFDILVTGVNAHKYSMVIALFTVPVGSLVAVISGHIAYARSKGSGLPGRKKAIAGLVLGYSGISLMCLSLIGLSILFNYLRT